MSELAALTAQFERHLATSVASEQAAAEREQRLADLLDKSLQSQKPSPLDRSASPPSPARVITKTVSVDRPVLSSSATSAEITACVTVLKSLYSKKQRKRQEQATIYRK